MMMIISNDDNNDDDDDVLYCCFTFTGIFKTLLLGLIYCKLLCYVEHSSGSLLLNRVECARLDSFRRRWETDGCPDRDRHARSKKPTTHR